VPSTGRVAVVAVGLDGRPVTEAIRDESPSVLAWYGPATGSLPRLANWP
jgi:hypothetical protein